MGTSRDSKSMLKAYVRMIRVKPEEFNLKKIKDLEWHVKGKLSKPDNFYTEEIRRNVRFQHKISELDDIVEKPKENALVEGSYWGSQQSNN